MKQLNKMKLEVMFLCCVHIWRDSVLSAPIFHQSLDLLFEETNLEYIAGFFEGDMNITLTRNGIVDSSKRWPDNTVNYIIDRTFDNYQQSLIRTSMRRIEQVSCITFKPADWSTSDYVLITGHSRGCFSAVGYQSGVQVLNLQAYPMRGGCVKFGTIVHELLHVLGFVHQQSTWNRDEYITIVEENIRKSNLKNFEKLPAKDITDFGVPYDYYSIMHYSAYAFSKNGRKTILPIIDENIEIGQRVDLSSGDVNKLRRMYKC